MQPLVIKIFLIQVLNFKQLCWLISNNTRQEWLHFVDKRLAAVQIYCCKSTLIKHSSAVLHPPPKSSGAISSLMCHSPSIQNPGNLTGVAKCVVKLYLFSLCCYCCGWETFCLFLRVHKVRKKQPLVPFPPFFLLMANALPAMAPPLCHLHVFG